MKGSTLLSPRALTLLLIICLWNDPITTVTSGNNLFFSSKALTVTQYRTASLVCAPQLAVSMAELCASFFLGKCSFIRREIYGME